MAQQHLRSHWYWRPDWTPGRTALWWYLTFEEHPCLEATGLALADSLRPEAGLDVNPGRWLHLTLRELGFADEIETHVVEASVAATGRAVQDVGPVLLHTAGTGLLPGAVVRWVEPRPEVERLRAAVVGAALPAAARPDEVAPEVVRPHVTVAYARRDLDATDLLGPLARPADVDLSVSHVVLAAVTRRQRHYEWQVHERLPLERGRSARG